MYKTSSVERMKLPRKSGGALKCMYVHTYICTLNYIRAFGSGNPVKLTLGRVADISVL
jgi:hypothetical protein